MSAKRKLKIRLLEFEDFEAVSELGEKVFTADKWSSLYRTWDKYEIIERFLGEGELCIVAEIGEEIVGFSIGTLIEKPKSKWVYGYILWVAVDPEAQGLGVGEKLLNAMTKRFIKLGANMMMIDTAMDNEKARRFFERNGFDKEEEHVFLYKNLETQKKSRRR